MTGPSPEREPQREGTGDHGQDQKGVHTFLARKPIPFHPGNAGKDEPAPTEPPQDCRRPIALDPQALRTRLTDTESIVEHVEAIPNVNWRLVERGQDVYVDRCEPCHGPFGRPPSARPTTASPPDLSAPAFQRSIDDDRLVQAVRHGRAGMPAIPTLRSDADARALVAFVRILSAGFELYSRHCASCHGDDGHPQREFVEARQRPTVVFDRSWFTRRDPTQLRTAVSHMLEERQPGMPHFRTTLSEPEARAILRYLRGAP